MRAFRGALVTFPCDLPAYVGTGRREREGFPLFAVSDRLPAIRAYSAGVWGEVTRGSAEGSSFCRTVLTSQDSELARAARFYVGHNHSHDNDSLRKKVKALFAELKNQIGLRRLRLRRLRFCAGTVLPGSRSAEPQTLGALPQSA